MNKILSLGGRLNKLIERTEDEAEQIVEEARKEADSIINSAKNEASQRLQRAQRRSGLNEFLQEAEQEAKIEAKKVLEDYIKRAEVISSVSDSELKEASKLIVQEVLIHE
jgi:vacuolar-type H+-ATPase subunit H